MAMMDFIRRQEVCLNHGWSLDETELGTDLCGKSELFRSWLEGTTESVFQSLYDDRIGMRIRKIEVRSPFQKREKRRMV